MNEAVTISLDGLKLILEVLMGGAKTPPSKPVVQPTEYDEDVEEDYEDLNDPEVEEMVKTYYEENPKPKYRGPARNTEQDDMVIAILKDVSPGSLQPKEVAARMRALGYKEWTGTQVPSRKMKLLVKHGKVSHVGHGAYAYKKGAIE